MTILMLTKAVVTRKPIPYKKYAAAMLHCDKLGGIDQAQLLDLLYSEWGACSRQQF